MASWTRPRNSVSFALLLVSCTLFLSCCGKKEGEQKKEGKMAEAAYESARLPKSGPPPTGHEIALKASVEFPRFPWPPPRASATAPVPNHLLAAAHGLTRLRDVDRRLIHALQQSGYYDSSYYAVPEGFALVTKMERINSDGTPKQGQQRWHQGLAPLGEFSISAYLKALLGATPGYFRVVVFVVTPYPFTQTTAQVTPEEAEGWLAGGLNALPGSIGDQDFSREGYSCTALIFEFERAAETENPKIRLPGLLPGQTHLARAGIWAALGGGPS